MSRRCSDFTPEDIFLGAKNGGLQIWIVYEEKIVAVVVTEIVKFSSRKVCLVKALAGRGIDQWIHLLDAVLIPWARASGCDTIRGYCRPGLAKILNWKVTKIVMEKEI